jgi:hypothetical protein
MAMLDAPRNDDLYECIEDASVSFVTHWRAPFTGGGTGTVPKGTTVRLVVNPAVVRPSAYYARPVDREAIEVILVPVADRTDSKFDGLSLVLTIEDLSKRFRLVQDQTGEAI